MPLLDVRPDHLKIVQDILQKHVPEREVWAFGSRAKWLAKEYSDLDLCIVGETPLGFLTSGLLKEAFEDSDLPYKVDLVDWATTSESFRKIIERDRVVVQKAGRGGVMDSDTQQTPYGPLPSSLSGGRLADLCLDDGVQTGPFGSQLHQEDYVPIGTPIITVEHLGENRIVHQDLPHVSDEDRQRLAKYSLKTGDIVFSRVGSVDRRAIVRESENGWLFSGRCLRVRPDPEKLDSQWLSYFFGLPTFKQYIRGIAVGATMPSINTKILSDVPIYFPALTEQRSAAKCLTSIDDKIALNRRINQILEAMAQAIFKSWFVDFDPVKAKIAAKQEGRDPLRAAMSAISGAGQGCPNAAGAGCAGAANPDADLDALPPEQYAQLAATAALFPDEMEASELGEIPRGWSVAPLGDFLTIKRGGSPRPIQEFMAPSGLPWVKIADATAEASPFLFATKEFIKESGLKKTIYLKSGSLVLTNSATPGLPKFLELDACIHDGWLYFPEKRLFSDQYLYFLFQKIRTELVAQGNGSVFTNLKTDILKGQRVLAPAQAIMDSFTALAGSLLDNIKALAKESTSLATLRDTLLPKLLSGELHVSTSD